MMPFSSAKVEIHVTHGLNAKSTLASPILSNSPAFLSDLQVRANEAAVLVSTCSAIWRSISAGM